MKRMQVVMLILLATFMLVQGVAYAKTVEGKVVSTDVAANSLTVSKTDAVTGASEDVVISVTDTTTYSGAASLIELKAGDQVSVEAEQDAVTSKWNASSVNRLGA